MEQIDWLQMLKYQQELHLFSRTMLVQSQKKLLTASELELLSLLYLKTEQTTPLTLSHLSGMKKEAVSRCLKQMYEKNLITKARHPQDERSYILTLTDQGREALRESYGLVLRPMYDLYRSMGNDFDKLFRLIEGANRQMNIQDEK